MRNTLLIGRIMLLMACLGVTALADVKIKSRQTAGGQTYENITHIKGKRQRVESMNGQMISIQQCDLKRDLQLMPQMKVYTVRYYEDSNSPSTDRTGGTGAAGTTTRGGLVTTTVTTKDTGERKEIFGYTARRIITTMETESSLDSCSPNRSKIIQDGWYIDATFQLICDFNNGYQNYRPAAKGGCQDRFETKQVGSAKKGYPVWEKTTMFDAKGVETFTVMNEVIEISQATVDIALFDAPADYREVKDFSEAYAPTSGAGGRPNSNDSSLNANVTKLATSGSAVPSTISEKKAGVVRLGLARVKIGAVGEGLNANELAAAVGATMADYLKALNIELVEIEARLPAQIDAEAKQKECDFVIYTNVSHKKGSGGFGGMFGSVAPAVGNVAPMAGYGSTAGAVAGHVATTVVYTASSMSANVKSKDEITLEIKLQVPGNGATAVNKQYKAKAKTNGEDIISPVIEQAVQAIVDAVAK